MHFPSTEKQPVDDGMDADLVH